MGPDFCDKQISGEDNQFLVAEFSEEEVKAVVDSCGSSKSPGPGGFNFGFLKEYWELFKEDFMLMFREFYLHGKLVLLDYRPISLIVGIYKVIAKVLSRSDLVRSWARLYLTNRALL